jgi:hypothetical protein
MAGRIHGILVLPPQPVTVATPGQMYYDSGYVYYFNGSVPVKIETGASEFPLIMSSMYWRW